MTPFHVILYTSLTIIVFVMSFLLFYWFRTKRLIKKSNEHTMQLENELKKGMTVLCAGGIIGVYQGSNADKTIAKVEISNGLVIETAFYSISSIIVDK